MYITITTQSIAQSIETHLLFVHLHSVFVLVAHIICRRWKKKQRKNENKIETQRKPFLYSIWFVELKSVVFLVDAKNKIIARVRKYANFRTWSKNKIGRSICPTQLNLLLSFLHWSLSLKLFNSLPIRWCMGQTT